jgi:hypothetical protein
MVPAMPTTQDVPPTSSASEPTASQDLATILSQLPRAGADDDVTRVVEIYERGERTYRAAVSAGRPTVGASASANR